MPTALPQPGESLGKYEILKELAIGGMAAIYLARARGTAGFEKQVVLKVILPNLVSDGALVTMFLEEARLAATLRHSNIADVFDVGNEGKRFYFAMEYVHGENARTVRIEAKQRAVTIPFEVSLATIMGTTAALAYAHARTGPDGKPLELIHRDISPSNIMISYEGAIKLVDFGIARASSRSGSRTRTGIRKGKVPYMSPEQCRGQAIDRRTDLFSLGTVLYELTTMQRPFLGRSDFEVMDAIVTCEPAPPSTIRRDYPPQLERIVMRLLARTPDARYQSANQLLEDIERFAVESGISTSAHAVSRFMGQLFEAPPPELEHGTFTGLGSNTVAYPDGQPPEALVSDGADEESTVAFSPGDHISSDLAAMLRTTKRAQTVNAPTGVSDEGSITAFGEATRQDLVLPFDPIDARSAELLGELDTNPPPRETQGARALRHVQQLMQVVSEALATGDAERGVLAVELALDRSSESERAQELLQQHVDTIVAAYEALLEDPYRVPVLTRTLDELDIVPLEPETRDLLPYIDGTASIREIVVRTQMQRLEVYHHLCQLLLRGVLG